MRAAGGVTIGVVEPPGIRALLIVSLAATVCTVAIVFVAGNHALDVQIAGAVGGSILLVGSVALMTRSWPRRAHSPREDLLFSLAFFAGSVGVFVLLASIGIFH